MASPMKQTRVRRAMKKVARGRKRKNYLNRHGSTAKRLPLTMPNANERNQKN